jgi:hypothetical protein
MAIQMTYTMGFAIGDEPIPDPNSFSGKESDLDTVGERDATGMLHRHKVATKHPLSIEYTNITWSMIQTLCALLKKEKFKFTYPDPWNGGLSTITAYVGDRNFTAVWSPEDEDWIGELKFSVIEY